MNKLKIAMIGCGRIAEMYKMVFKQLSDMIEVVYAVDVIKERADKFASEFIGCTSLKDYEEIFTGAKKVDVVHIATPHYLHSEMAIEAMKRDINVLVEKPIAIRLSDADEMIKISEEQNVKFGVIFQTRYVKGVREIKKIIENGKIGKLKAARSFLTWKRSNNYYRRSNWKGTWDKEGGGVLIDQAIHSIDRVQWLIDSQVEWIKGTTDNRVHPEVSVEDIAEATIMFENKCVYNLYANNSYGYDAPIEIEIVGEKGRIGLKQDLAWIKINGEPTIEIKDGYDGLSVGPDYWGCSHITQIKDFYFAIINDGEVEVDGREGKKALEIVKGIYKSAKTKKRVYFPFQD